MSAWVKSGSQALPLACPLSATSGHAPGWSQQPRKSDNFALGAYSFDLKRRLIAATIAALFPVWAPFCALRARRPTLPAAFSVEPDESLRAMLAPAIDEFVLALARRAVGTRELARRPVLVLTRELPSNCRLPESDAGDGNY